MRTSILTALVGLMAAGCFLRHKDSVNYTAVPGLVETPTNGPTITIVSNTPAPPPVQETKPVPTVAATNTATPAPTAPVAAAPVEHAAVPQTPPAAVPPITETNSSKPIVTPAQGLTGKVASVNPAGKFVVLSFPLGQMPAFDQMLNLYRKGVKVAEAKVTGPKLDENIVADLSQGNAEVGDDVRDR